MIKYFYWNSDTFLDSLKLAIIFTDGFNIDKRSPLNSKGLFEKKLTGQVLHTQNFKSSTCLHVKSIYSVHLIFPDLTLQQVRGHRLHPVLPRLHPGKPSLHLPPLSLKFLIVNIKLLKLALPREDLKEKHNELNEMKEKKNLKYFPLVTGKTFLMREKL